MTILINPKSPNQMPTRAIEPPIWCVLMAKNDDRIVDMEIESKLEVYPDEDIIIVVMGNNPSASSTPKMVEASRLRNQLKLFGENVKITGLHPMATGEATCLIPPPEELVKIKMAQWRKLDMSKYRAHNWHCLQDIDNRDKYAALYTSYGCPFNCSYCNVHTIYRTRRVFYRKPIEVLEEIDYLVKVYGVKNLKICDELFTLNHKHVTEICELIKGYHLNIWAYARVGTVTPELLRKMKGAGVNWLAYGFESGDESVLRGVSKRYGDIFETVQETKNAGINVMGNFIFGLPDDTPGSMRTTLELAQKLECEYVNFYCAMAYPGSKLYKGEDKDWSHYDQYNPVPMGTKYLTPQEVVGFRNEAFRKYFTDEHYLKMIEHKFGMKALSHIKGMI